MAEIAEGVEKNTEEADSEPIFIDEFFRKKPKKHGREWKVVDAPYMFEQIADTHAHLDMLPNPALALARAGVHRVGFIETMVDPLGSEGVIAFDSLDDWIHQANIYIRQMSTRICGQGWKSVPKVRISIGVHPHEAKDYNSQVEKGMVDLMHDPRVSAVGEIGLDYHYDLSPRDVQKEVFVRQVQLAEEAGLPVVLHVREAFDDAYSIMQDVTWPSAGTLLHCYTSDAQEIERWVDAGCYVAFGGAATFKKLDDIRAAVRLVPRDRLLLETDAPFMTPEPFRGITCEPAHVIWTADYLANFLHEESVEERERLLAQTYESSIRLLDRRPTEWQLGD